MISASYKIIVRFTPVKKHIDEFSDKILNQAKGVTLSGGSYASYPSVNWNTDNQDAAIAFEKSVKYIIENHGGTVVE